MSGYRVHPMVFISLTRKIVTATGSKARATPPPPPPTHPAAVGSVRVGRGELRRADGHCRGGLPRAMPCAGRHGAPVNRAYAGRYGALVGPAAAASHAQCPAPAAVARPPTAPTQAVGVGRGRGLGRRVRAWEGKKKVGRVLEAHMLNIMFVWERRGRIWMELFPFFSLCRRVQALSGS